MFYVSLSELAATKAKVAELNKKAAKAGIPAQVSIVEHSRREIVERSELGFERRYVVVEAEFVGLADVKLGDWKLVAVIDHDPAGNVINKVPNFPIEVPAEYRSSAASRCDHCQAVRNRNNTVLVWNEAEGFKQVGSDCVKLFLGVSPSSLIAFIKEAKELGDDEFSGGWANVGPSVSEFVAAAALVIEVYGFKPSSFQGATRSLAWDLVSPPRSDAERARFKRECPELVNPDAAAIERANKLSSEAVAWIAENNESGDYILNLKAAAAREEVGRNAGLLASLPQAYKKAMALVAEREAKAALPPSEFVGSVGAKVSVKAKVVYRNRSEGYSYYGPDSLFLILVGEDGNKFFVRTSVGTAVAEVLENADKDEFFNVAGTVKEHKVSDKGEKITVLTRTKAVKA